jgi:alkyl sulfatase BDS1-like metallo-beta-lactamase superfamily hydrolase
MTRDDVIRLAREAGDDVEHTLPSDLDFLGRFADLVAAAEREACAKAIENSIGQIPDTSDWANGYIQAAKDIAEGIRARGNQ